MDCSRFLYGYTDYDDSLLAPAEEAEFREHLASCEACSRYDRVLRKGRMLARQVAAEPARDFMPRLQHRLLAGARLAPAPLRPAVAGGFLTLLAVAVTGLWLFGADPGTSGRAVAAAVPGAPEARLVAARPVSLPALAGVGPADWTTGRVDRENASSYSPLVIGPPAYRADASVRIKLSSTTRRTLD